MSEEPCTKLGAELSGYHDGMLDEATRQKVEAHLQSCAVCRARLAEYARVDRAVHALGAPLFEDRLREDLVAYARATIADRGRQNRRQRQLAQLRSWRTVVPLAAAAGVAVLVLKLSDGGFQTLSQRRESPAATRSTFESQAKLRAEADSQRGATGALSAPPASVPSPMAGLRDSEPEQPTASPATVSPDAQKETQAFRSEDSDLDRKSGMTESETVPSPAPDDAQRLQEPSTWGGVQSQSQPHPELAKEEGAVAVESPPAPAAESASADVMHARAARAKDQSAGNVAAPAPPPAASPPPPPSGGGHLDPEAALSIASLALQVGDLTGARLALQGLPTLPPDSLTARAAVLALTIAERSLELVDCRAARERADALVEAAPSSALADTLRVRRAALPCPH